MSLEDNNSNTEKNLKYLDDILGKINDNLEKNLRKELADDNLLFYLIFKFNRLNSYTYLIPINKNLNVSIDSSNIAEKYLNWLKGQESPKPILKENEVAQIISNSVDFYGMKETLDTIRSLIDKVTSSNTSDTNMISLVTSFKKRINDAHSDYTLLRELIDIFNSHKITVLTKVKANSHSKRLMNLLIRALLLCFQQLPSKYSAFNEANKNKIEQVGAVDNRAISFIDQKNKEELFSSNLNTLHNASFPDRLFLLISIVESTLWAEGNFIVGNIFHFLNEESSNNTFASNSFYLKPIDFYICGKFTNNEFKEKLSNIKDYFNEELNRIIQFAKFFAADSNYLSVIKNKEFSNSLLPLSIAHGLTHIFTPKYIHIYKWELFKEDIGKIILNTDMGESFKFNTKLYAKIGELGNSELFNNPWAMYENDKERKPSKILDNFKESYTIHEKNQQLIVKTKNAFNSNCIIILDFGYDSVIDPKDLFEYSELLFTKNIYEFQYALKAYIDKLSYIHKSVSLNTDTNNWYKKAFCKLYIKFDRLRHSLDNHNKELNDDLLVKVYKTNPLHKEEIKRNRDYRNFEKILIEEIKSSQESTVKLLDIGIGYGRFETKLLSSEVDIDVVGIDSSNYLLEELAKNFKVIKIKDPSTPHEKNTIQLNHWDFRNLDYLREQFHYICFIYTTFGYFKEAKENEEILRNAYNLLFVGGKLIIEQFNPYIRPMHCGEMPEIYDYKPEKEPNYRLVKTSNFKIIGEILDENNEIVNTDYSLYYGNYVYFDTTGNTEEIIKCDTYEIKLYSKEWFQAIFPQAKIRYFNLDGNEELKEFKPKDQPIMLIEITKELTEIGNETKINSKSKNLSKLRLKIKLQHPIPIPLDITNLIFSEDHSVDCINLIESVKIDRNWVTDPNKDYDELLETSEINEYILNKTGDSLKSYWEDILTNVNNIK
jgi:SAM-dependent methyltransferase